MHNKYLAILTNSIWLIWFTNQTAIYNHALHIVVGVGIGVVVDVICAHPS